MTMQIKPFNYVNITHTSNLILVTIQLYHS
jgi:hypothetical protein